MHKIERPGLLQRRSQPLPFWNTRGDLRNVSDEWELKQLPECYERNKDATIGAPALLLVTRFATSSKGHRESLLGAIGRY